MQQIFLILGICLCLLLPCVVLAKGIAPIALSKTFNGSMESAAYWVSEKFDGIRCYWDGKALYTRNGNLIHAPKWFVDGLPSEPLDGELWAGRGGYQKVAKTVLDKTPNQEQWQQITYQVFDLPSRSQTFEVRQQTLKAIIERKNKPFLKWVKQTKVDNLGAINAALDNVVSLGGEGLILRPLNSLYEVGRSDTMLKLKVRQDSEARVIAYQAGRGKYENMMGAVWVELANGKMFKIGSGFSDDERQNPPPIGSEITFSHEGYTEKGLPRFATFERIKAQE